MKRTYKNGAQKQRDKKKKLAEAARSSRSLSLWLGHQSLRIQSETSEKAARNRDGSTTAEASGLVRQQQRPSRLVGDVAAAPQTPQLGGPRPTLGAQVSLKLLFGYVTIFSSADLFTTDLNCRKKLACDIISECNVILSRRI